MRVFANHCVPTDLVEALRKRGVKIERAIKKGLDKTSDEGIFNYILKTSQVLLTFDKDFGNIIRFNIKNSKGVVVVYTERMNKNQVIEKVINFFREIKEKELKGALFIIEPEEVRIWRG